MGWPHKGVHTGRGGELDSSAPTLSPTALPAITPALHRMPALNHPVPSHPHQRCNTQSQPDRTPRPASPTQPVPKSATLRSGATICGAAVAAVHPTSGLPSVIRHRCRQHPLHCTPLHCPPLHPPTPLLPHPSAAHPSTAAPSTPRQPPAPRAPRTARLPSAEQLARNSAPASKQRSVTGALCSLSSLICGGGGPGQGQVEKLRRWRWQYQQQRQQLPGQGQRRGGPQARGRECQDGGGGGIPPAEAPPPHSPRSPAREPRRPLSPELVLCRKRTAGWPPAATVSRAHRPAVPAPGT